MYYWKETRYFAFAFTTAGSTMLGGYVALLKGSPPDPDLPFEDDGIPSRIEVVLYLGWPAIRFAVKGPIPKA